MAQERTAKRRLADPISPWTGYVWDSKENIPTVAQDLSNTKLYRKSIGVDIEDSNSADKTASGKYMNPFGMVGLLYNVIDLLDTKQKANDAIKQEAENPIEEQDKLGRQVGPDSPSDARLGARAIEKKVGDKEKGRTEPNRPSQSAQSGGGMSGRQFSSSTIILDLDGVALHSGGDFSAKTLNEKYLNKSLMSSIKGADVYIVTGRTSDQNSAIRSFFSKYLPNLKAVYTLSPPWSKEKYHKHKRSKFELIKKKAPNAVVYEDSSTNIKIAKEVGLRTRKFHSEEFEKMDKEEN